MPYRDYQTAKENKTRYWHEKRKFMPTNKYQAHKSRAKKAGIDFLLSFEEWWDIWQHSGYWEQRGKGSKKYCMCRKGDIGPYSKDNVYIALNRKNWQDAWDNGRTKHLPEPKLTKEQRLEIYNAPKIRGNGVQLAEKYGVDPARISQIRKGISLGANSGNSR